MEGWREEGRGKGRKRDKGGRSEEGIRMELRKARMAEIEGKRERR